MREFRITENQINMILNALGKYPAEEVVGAIDMLRFEIGAPKNELATGETKKEGDNG